MKVFLALISVFVLVAANDHDVCRNDVTSACSPTGSKDTLSCNSLLGGFEQVQSYLQSYVNTQLATSYDYLLLSTHFDTYQKNRPGFYKVFKELSDKAWDKAVDLIKHITKRGGVMDFNQKHEIPSTLTHEKNKLEVDELHGLAIVLDSEKKLATDAHDIHRRASHHENQNHYDPEISQYIEEEFLEYQTETIRKLSGYVNDLSKIMRTTDASLGVYLFDEYLQKQ